MMESRKNTLSDLKTCRFCLSNDGNVSSLYDRSRTPKSAISLPLQIMSCVSVEVFPSDRLLAYICDRCRFFMETCYKFKQICRQADESVMQFVQNNESLVPISWPAKLNKLYRLATQSPKKPSKNPISDTTSPNATNASSHEDDSDEGEGDVYNIKIGDGPDDDSTCIKVVKTGDKLHITKDDLKTTNKKCSSPAMRQARPEVERPFPCKYCDKSFMKSHHYARHVRIKHNGISITSRGPFGEQNSLICDQCDESFSTQDDLIYHSAKHATENLTCPLCHEKFQHVEQVSAHIKTHVDGAEFMCDLCELVFTSREKLDQHLVKTHEDELNQEQEDIGLDEDESMDDGTYEDDNIHVKEVGDEMIVEIKKPDEFYGTQPEQINNDINSEESESDTLYTELAAMDTLAPAKEPADENPVQNTPPRETVKPISKTEKLLPKPVEKKNDTQTASILRKAEEIKRKAAQKQMEILSNVTIKPAIAPTVTKSETTTSSAGASDKSLRLLEKELQELKRTNNQNKESSDVKTPAKSMEVLRNKRPQLHTSTPKPRVVEEKRSISTKPATVDKKQAEQPRRVITKENKEPKEKEAKGNNNNTTLKDEKDNKEQKDTAKPIAKNNSSDKINTENDNVRRSSRSSKVKDYAKLVRDRMESSDDDSDDDDEEYKEAEKIESRNRSKKLTPKAKPSPAASEATPTTARKRGRPRKDQTKEIPAKVKKSIIAEEEINESGDANVEKDKNEPTIETTETTTEIDKKEVANENNKECSNLNSTDEAKPNLMVSPSGHTLKKVPIKSLPPGVKPLPLPLSARSSLGSGELSEMRIGKKVVKVQKIVMTKAEVEAMAKKGLVEMKYGTMVLKQGIKLQSSDATSLKTALIGDNDPDTESPKKQEKGTPTRCMFNEDS